MYYDIASAGFPDNALAFTIRVTDFCHTLDTFPQRGTPRFKIRPGLRVVSYKDQVTIAFQIREAAKEVFILRILRKGQSLEKAFKHAR